jgi:hypothetical protein
VKAWRAEHLADIEAFDLPRDGPTSTPTIGSTPLI